MSYNAGNMPTGYIWIMANAGHEDDECLLWPFCISTPGYGQFAHEGKLHSSHRYMCRLKNGDPPTSRSQAAHSCGNRRCCNPNHLSWKSPSDNQRDRRHHGTNCRIKTKITRLQAAQIRQLKGVETAIQTAARYGITESNVRQIQEGKTWRTIGRKHNHALTPDQAQQIKLIGFSKSAREVAEMFGVSENAIWRARNNKTATARQST